MSNSLTTNVDQRALRTTKFPPEFNVKVDMKKVELSVIKKWVADQIYLILGNDDDVVPELVFNTLEKKRFPNIKELQISLAGFLDKHGPIFCQQLWNLCISAQNSPQGVPIELLEAKKQELIEEDKAKKLAIERAAADHHRERELDDIRNRERFNRGNKVYDAPPRRNGHEMPVRRSQSPDSRRYARDLPSRRSRSPRRHHEREDRYTQSRGTDSYVPSRSSKRHERRQRSPSYDRSRSRSTTPPAKRRRRDTSSSTESRKSSRRHQSSRSKDRSVSRERRRRSRRTSSSPPRKASRSRSRSLGRSRRHRRRPSVSPDTRDSSPRPRKRKHEYDRNWSPSRSPRRLSIRDQRRNTSSVSSAHSSPSPPPAKQSRKEASTISKDLIKGSNQYKKDTRRLSRDTEGSDDELIKDTAD